MPQSRKRFSSGQPPSGRRQLRVKIGCRAACSQSFPGLRVFLRKPTRFVLLRRWSAGRTLRDLSTCSKVLEVQSGCAAAPTRRFSSPAPIQERAPITLAGEGKLEEHVAFRYSRLRETLVALRQLSIDPAATCGFVFSAWLSVSSKHRRLSGSGAVTTSDQTSRRWIPIRSNGLWVLGSIGPPSLDHTRPARF
jgi:hypothetical protein